MGKRKVLFPDPSTQPVDPEFQATSQFTCTRSTYRICEDVCQARQANFSKDICRKTCIHHNRQRAKNEKLKAKGGSTSYEMG